MFKALAEKYRYETRFLIIILLFSCDKIPMAHSLKESTILRNTLHFSYNLLFSFFFFYHLNGNFLQFRNETFAFFDLRFAQLPHILQTKILTISSLYFYMILKTRDTTGSTSRFLDTEDGVSVNTRSTRIVDFGNKIKRPIILLCTRATPNDAETPVASSTMFHRRVTSSEFTPPLRLENGSRWNINTHKFCYRHYFISDIEWQFKQNVHKITTRQISS